MDEECSYSEVARRLGIAPATVRYHLSEAGVLRKKRRTRAELAAENAQLRQQVRELQAALQGLRDEQAQKGDA